MKSKFFVILLCLISLLQIGWSSKDSALIEAVKKGEPGKVQILLKQGVNPNLRSYGGKTLLMLAAEKGDTGIAKLLLEAGANLEAVDHKNKTALLIARENARVDMVILLNSWGNMDRQSVQNNPASSPEPTINQVKNKTQKKTKEAVSKKQDDQIIVDSTLQVVTVTPDKNLTAPETKMDQTEQLEETASTMENIESENKSITGLPVESTTPAPKMSIKEKLISLFFEFNHSNLQADEIAKVQGIIPMLKEQSKLFIILGGHADELGNSNDNILKSGQRVAAVKKYLINEGIAEEQIIIYTYGEAHPLNKGHDEEARAQNRRVDLFVSESALSAGEMLSKTVQ